MTDTIKLTFKSAFDGEFHWEAFCGGHLLGRVAVRDNTARWIGYPGDAVPDGVLDAIYSERCSKIAEAVAAFGPGFLQDHDAPTRPNSLY